MNTERLKYVENVIRLVKIKVYIIIEKFPVKNRISTAWQGKRKKKNIAGKIHHVACTLVNIILRSAGVFVFVSAKSLGYSYSLAESKDGAVRNTERGFPTSSSQ